MYKPNGNISMAGLTPEMFESAIDPILECSNLYKMLRCSINKWKDMCDDNIAKVLLQLKYDFNFYEICQQFLYKFILFLGIYFCCI